MKRDGGIHGSSKAEKALRCKIGQWRNCTSNAERQLLSSHPDYNILSLIIYDSTKWGSKHLKKPLLLNCPPHHLHEVPLLYTKVVVDDRVLAGICESQRRRS